MYKIYTVLLLFLFTAVSYTQDQFPKLQYVYPKANSMHVNPETSLILGFDRELTPDQINSLDIKLKTAQHKTYICQVVITEGNRTLVIKHNEPFIPGETILVTFNTAQISSSINEFSFNVTGNTWNPELRKPMYEEKPVNFKSINNSAAVTADGDPTVINGVAVPSDFPLYELSIEGETAPGYLFLSNWTGTPYIMILENDGTPIYYEKVEATSIDFKLQETGVLTRHIREGDYRYVSMDSNYNYLDTFMCQNGYGTDEHELILLENGHALLIAVESRTIDMSAIVTGGQPDATVIGNHVQEIDENDNVVFEFNCFDNFDITGATGEDLTANSIDYVHMNSIAVDYDSNLLISSRSLNECTKINRTTGEIMWRLGGKFNEFTLVDETDSLDHQHDIRPVPGIPGNYTIYDNGNDRGYTRAVEYQIDTVAMTATKVWEYRHSPDRLGTAMGNAQRLSNGNTLINWASGNLPKATEVNTAGDVLYEGNFVENSAGYRTFRFEWNGYLEEPYLILEPLPDTVRLIFNKFGDTTVTKYRIYGGTSPSSEDLIDSTSNTWIDLGGFENNQTYYFKVTAVDDEGTESGFSNTDSIYIRNPTPGDNLIRNGDFSEGTAYWDFYLYGGDAVGSVNADTQFVFDITDGGSMEVAVQLRQNYVPLYQGYTYIFEFDAVADASRTIVAKVGMDQNPYTNYSRIGNTYITDEYEHYSYEFDMTDPTDLNCRVVFNCGNSTGNVTIDNVSLSVKEEEEPEQVSSFTANGLDMKTYPNPVHDRMTIQFTVPLSGTVNVDVYDVAGKLVLHNTPVNVDGGINSVELDMSEIQPGVHICNFEFLPADGGDKTIIHHKIVKSEK